MNIKSICNLSKIFLARDELSRMAQNYADTLTQAKQDTSSVGATLIVDALSYLVLDVAPPSEGKPINFALAALNFMSLASVLAPCQITAPTTEKNLQAAALALISIVLNPDYLTCLKTDTNLPYQLLGHPISYSELKKICSSVNRRCSKTDFDSMAVQINALAGELADTVAAVNVEFDRENITLADSLANLADIVRETRGRPVLQTRYENQSRSSSQMSCNLPKQQEIKNIPAAIPEKSTNASIFSSGNSEQSSVEKPKSLFGLDSAAHQINIDSSVKFGANVKQTDATSKPASSLFGNSSNLSIFKNDKGEIEFRKQETDSTNEPKSIFSKPSSSVGKSSNIFGASIFGNTTFGSGTSLFGNAASALSSITAKKSESDESDGSVDDANDRAETQANVFNPNDISSKYYVGDRNQLLNEAEVVSGDWDLPTVALSKVDHKMGEENEENIWESRAILYRFKEGEWVSRGIGRAKLLKSAEGLTRLIFRNEVTNKILANHFVPSAKNGGTAIPKPDNALFSLWHAYDCSGETAEYMQLALKVKTVEAADDFRSIFNKAGEDNAVKATAGN